jgi:hypothetical protein
MTAGTITPHRSEVPVAGGGFSQLVRAEWTKFRTVRGWMVGMLVAGLLVVGIRHTRRSPPSTLLSLGVAAAVRDSVAAIGIVLGLLYLFPIIGAAVGNAQLDRHIQQIGPMTAGLAVQATTDLDQLPIGPWAGLGVLAAWAAAALLAGGLLLHRRDA